MSREEARLPSEAVYWTWATKGIGGIAYIVDQLMQAGLPMTDTGRYEIKRAKELIAKIEKYDETESRLAVDERERAALGRT